MERIARSPFHAYVMVILMQAFTNINPYIALIYVKNTMGITLRKGLEPANEAEDNRNQPDASASFGGGLERVGQVPGLKLQ